MQSTQSEQNQTNLQLQTLKKLYKSKIKIITDILNTSNIKYQNNDSIISIDSNQFYPMIIKEHCNVDIIGNTIYFSKKRKDLYLNEEFCKQAIVKHNNRKTKEDSEDFTQVVQAIVSNLIRKPSFSGYTEEYRDEMQSNATYRCFKYIHNFDPNKISDRTGEHVKAFAYVTQVVRMSFIESIKKLNLERDKRLKFNVDYGDVAFVTDVHPNQDNSDDSIKDNELHKKAKKNELVFDNKGTLFDFIKENKTDYMYIKYPKDYTISTEEYKLITSLQFNGFSLVREA